MYLRGDVSAKVIVSQLEKDDKLYFITLILPRQGQNHHMLKFLAEMRRGGQVYQEIDLPRPNSSMMIRESLVADCRQSIKQI